MQDPQCEFLTYETIQTYRGHKPDRTIVMKEKHDMVESEAQKSPCAQRFLRSSSNSVSETPNGHLSSEEKLDTNEQQKDSNTTQTEQKKQQQQKQQPQINGNDADVSKKRVTIAKSSLTPPISSSNTPQRVRRSQSLSSTRSTGFTEFEKSCLKAHNEYRAKHAVPPLKLNKRLCRFSEEWAKVSALFSIIKLMNFQVHLKINFHVSCFISRYLHPEVHQSIGIIHHTVKIYFAHGAPFRIWL